MLAVQSTLAQFYNPAKQALLPRIVSQGSLLRANGILSVNTNLARIVGGSAGGLLVAFGGSVYLAVGYLSAFLAASVCLAFITAAPEDRGGVEKCAEDKPTWSLSKGVGEVFGVHGIGRIFLAFAFVAFGQGLTGVLLVSFVFNDLHGDSTLAGLLRSAPAMGGLMGGGLLALIGIRVKHARLATGAALGLAALSVTIWNSPVITVDKWFYVTIFAFLGTPSVFFHSTLTTTLQTVRPDLLGRVFGLSSSIYNGMQVSGMAIAGVLGDKFGEHVILNLQVLLYLGAALASVRVHSLMAK